MDIPQIDYGVNSDEKGIQKQREMIVLQEIYFDKNMIPETPKEPDAEPFWAQRGNQNPSGRCELPKFNLFIYLFSNVGVCILAGFFPDFVSMFHHDVLKFS